MLIAVVAILTALVLGGISLEILRRRRTPPELRGDWWGRFERAFWSYVATQSRPSPKRLDHDLGMGVRREEI